MPKAQAKSQTAAIPDAVAMGYHSISRSVARLFEILDIFRETRRPCGVNELQKKLDYPYSSVRAILMNMVELGYLSYRAEDRTYFPTEKIQALGAWLPSAKLKNCNLRELLRILASDIDESIGIANRASIFCNWVTVRNCNRPNSTSLPLGIGLTLSNSVTGRVILSQLDEPERERVLAYTKFWCRNNHADALMPDRAKLEAACQFITKHGYLTEYNTWEKGYGTIAFPIGETLSGTPLALSICGSSNRLRENEDRIRATVANLLRLYAEPSVLVARAAQPFPHAQLADGRTRPTLAG